jgi:hypothetical protein
MTSLSAPSRLWLFLLVAAVSLCQNAGAQVDTIFVEEDGRSGVYLETIGRIDTITSEYLILKTELGNRVLYTREIVKRLVIDTTHSQYTRNTVGVYWCKDRSFLVQLLQQTPGLGGLSSLLDYVPRGVDIFIAILVLLVLLSYASYRAYVTLVIAARTRDLNSWKLRYEIAGLRKQLGAVTGGPADTIETLDSEQKEDTATSTIPLANMLEFLKRKVLRLLTDGQKQEHHDLWLNRWRSLKQKSNWMPKLVFYALLPLYWWLTGIMFMLSLGSFIDTFLFLFMSTEIDSSGAVSPWFSLCFLIMFLVSLSLLFRFNTQRRILRSSYREVQDD